MEDDPLPAEERSTATAAAAAAATVHDEFEAEHFPRYAFTVDVLYGPTCIFGVMKHRTGWVESVADRLERMRFRVNVRRTSDFEMVAFAFEGRVVFACAAKSLSFAGCASRDSTADAAVRTLVAERHRAVADMWRSRTASAVASAFKSRSTRSTTSAMEDHDEDRLSIGDGDSWTTNGDEASGTNEIS